MEQINKPKPPTKELIESLLANGLADVAQQKLSQFPDIKLKIKDGKVFDVSSGTESFLRSFITMDEDMLLVKEYVRKLAPLQDEVLITGETGTGKEIIARALHGDRPADKFTAINCAGLPEHLIESELFGHVAGAFTGATKANPGMMKLANGGTFFLDEIGELPIHVQAKLLRALQEKKIRKVGGSQDEDITCRIVCATHRNLAQMVELDKFRQDLYARISTFELHLKPLRDRTNDIMSIIASLDGGKEYIAEWEKDQSKGIDTKLNVRSLQQIVKRFKVLGKL